MSDRRPPNRGMKVRDSGPSRDDLVAATDTAQVDLGKNAPVTQEGAGAVAAGSLAHESNSSGGAFSTNRQREAVPAGDVEPTLRGDNSVGGGTQRFTPSEEGQGATAPSYVNNQYYRDPKGPHGKNLTEGFEDDDKHEDGVAKAFAADVGSEDDPSRVAERKFVSKPPAEGQGASISGHGRYNVLEADETL